jgi:hypothetical protein
MPLRFRLPSAVLTFTLLVLPVLPASGQDVQTVIVPLPPKETPIISPVPLAKPAPPASVPPRLAQQHRRSAAETHRLASSRRADPAHATKAKTAADDRQIRRAAAEELAHRQAATGGVGGSPAVQNTLSPPRVWPRPAMSIPSPQIASAALPPEPPPYGYGPGGPPWPGPYGTPYGYPWPRGPGGPR